MKHLLVLTIVSALTVIGSVSSAADAWEDSYFSWANYWDTTRQETVDYVTPVVHDQESYSLCGMMSIVGAIESQILWRLHAGDSAIDVAEKWIIMCHGNPNSCLAGSSAATGPAKSTGLPHHDCFPEFETFDCDTSDCSDACDDSLAWATYIDGALVVETDDSMLCGPIQYVKYVTADSLKRAIVQSGPIALAGWHDLDVMYEWGHQDSG